MFQLLSNFSTLLKLIYFTFCFIPYTEQGDLGNVQLHWEGKHCVSYAKFRDEKFIYTNQLLKANYPIFHDFPSNFFLFLQNKTKLLDTWWNETIFQIFVLKIGILLSQSWQTTMSLTSISEEVQPWYPWSKELHPQVQSAYMHVSSSYASSVQLGTRVDTRRLSYWHTCDLPSQAHVVQHGPSTNPETVECHRARVFKQPQGKWALHYC